MQLAPLPADRLVERPPPESKAAARRFAVIVLLCFLAHALSIFVFGRSGTESPPPPEEIDVEIVAEPPPPEEPKPAPSSKEQKEQPAQQATLDEKEATDAPRDVSKEKREKEVRVEAPPSEKPKPEPQTAEPAKNSEKPIAAKSAEESAQQPVDDHLEGEPLKAADKPRPEPAEQAKAEKAAPEPVKPKPEDVLAAALKYSPVGGGNAETTYLTTVYGLVIPHMNLRKVAAGRRHQQGELVFAIDYGGALMGAKITKSSGLADVDAAALAAVRAAAPFPLPPTGSGINLVFRFKGE
jgi:TonB family protein